MIKNEEREELKKFLNYNYVKDVSVLLKERNVKNRKGAFYSESMIRRVFNGFSDNLSIENAILEVYQMRKIQKKIEFENKREILGLLDNNEKRSNEF